MPGVSELIKYGRIGDPVRARTLFKCRILFGYAHSQYEASLSPQTAGDLHTAVDEFRQEIEETSPGNRVKVVSVTTGNYLGKLLPYSCQEINSLLGLSGTQVGYLTLTNWSQKAEELVMVVTTRRPEYFRDIEPCTLGLHLGQVQAEIRERFPGQRLREIPFDPMEDVRVRTQTGISGASSMAVLPELGHEVGQVGSASVQVIAAPGKGTADVQG